MCEGGDMLGDDVWEDGLSCKGVDGERREKCEKRDLLGEAGMCKERVQKNRCGEGKGRGKRSLAGETGEKRHL